MAKKKKKGFLQAYIKSIIPPYSKKDFFPVLCTLIFITGFVFVLKPVLAQFADTTPPSQPVWNATIGPVAPYVHGEQGTLHIHLIPSKDNVGVVGYRIYKGDSWTNISSLAATVTSPNYSDFNGGGRNFYAIEAFDAAGNVSPRTIESTYVPVPGEWGGCPCPSAAVLSGWVTNAKTGAYYTGYLVVELTNGRIKNMPKLYLHFNNYANYGLFAQLFQEVTVDGTYQVTLRADGYETLTKDITLKSGRSVETYWQLTPTKNGR